MAPVKGVKGMVATKFKTSDGQLWDRMSRANAHQRNINKTAYMDKLVREFGVSVGDSNAIDPAKLTIALRTNSLFRKRFMLAINY